MKLSFHGAVGGVTGSCYLLETDDLKILVDCGMFQGGRETEQKNFDEFGFDPAKVDFLLLSHGHLDHCGRIPLLVNRGFRGRIICTAATFDIARLVMLDTAEVQEEDAAVWKKIRKRRGEKPPEPLYTKPDVLEALDFFAERAEYGRPVSLNDRASVVFRDAGHILGASFLELSAEKGKKIVFSGDLGNRRKPIVKDPEYPGKADVCVIEGTYSDRLHKDFQTSVSELYDAIRDTCARGGNVLIPSFAIERTQDLLYVLRELHESDDAPPCSVYLDSPMAIDVTRIIRRHPAFYNGEARRLLKANRDLFSFPGLHLTATPDESRKINFIESRAVIIAGSGMCTGGRIKHHLIHNIWREGSSIIFVGYQAEGTLGRQIVDGAPEVKIFGETYPVRAAVYTIGGFSAHADRNILLNWLKRCERPQHVFLVHGEDSALSSFGTEIRKRDLAENVHRPGMHEGFEL